MATRVMQIAFFIFLGLCLITGYVTDRSVKGEEEVTKVLESTWVARFQKSLEREMAWTGRGTPWWRNSKKAVEATTDEDPTLDPETERAFQKRHDMQDATWWKNQPKNAANAPFFTGSIQ